MIPPKKLPTLPKAITEIADDLTLICPRPTISEEVFMAHWLHMFVTPDSNLLNWVNVSGSLFEPVDIIASGHVVATVPALTSKDFTILRPDSSLDVSALVKDALQIEAVNPQQAHSMMIKHMATELNQNKIDYASIEQWNALFTRYGFPEMVVDLNNPTKPAIEVTESQGNQSFEDF